MDAQIIPFPEFDCWDCRDTGELPNGDACQECCDHDEMDHHICYRCKKDTGE